jgi:arsenate reductase-like glutaredoxin family protein
MSNAIPETLKPIQAAAEKAANARQALAEELAELEAAQRAIQKQHQRAINHYAQKYADANATLRNLVEGSPQLFQRPKTQTLHGVKLGFKKSQGKIEFPNQSKSVGLIKKHLPELADTLIDRTEKPSKAAAKNLQVGQLKKIGGQVVEGEDKVVVSYPENDLSKMIDAVMQEQNPT